MNAREARRQAARRLAQAARLLCAGVGSNAFGDGLSDADRCRMVDAFNALSHGLDVRAGDAVREKAAPVDPFQQALFIVDQRESGREQEVEQETADREGPDAG